MQQITSNLADEAITPCGLTGAEVKAFVMRALTAPSGRGKKPLFTVETLAKRPIYIQPTEADMASIPTDSILVVADYPFGRHKCVRVEFMECRDKHGYRHVSATSDKSFSKFNAPKAGTYNMGVVSLSWGETNGKGHPTFTVHHLNVYDFIYATRPETVVELMDKADEKFRKLNLSEADSEFLRRYFRGCNLKLSKLLQAG